MASRRGRPPKYFEYINKPQDSVNVSKSQDSVNVNKSQDSVNIPSGMQHSNESNKKDEGGVGKQPDAESKENRDKKEAATTPTFDQEGKNKAVSFKNDHIAC
jgi:hypothetical protein